MCACECVCVHASHSCGFTCIGAGTYVQASCIVCGHVEANEGGTESEGQQGVAVGSRDLGGVRATGNSRSGAATPVTSVGASANQ